MKLLLDTHVFIWADSAPQKLTARATAACQDAANQLLLSVASVWEMQLKLMLRKLTLHKPLRQLIDDWRGQNSLVVLPVELEHILHLDTLPAHHKDPFDRLLVAQAIVEGCSIVSQDRAVGQYSVPVVW